MTDNTKSKKIAIIGAGFSGLLLATQLKSVFDRVDAPVQFELFEKSRGVSGRMSTRYAGDFEFDHGAPFFSASFDSFKAFLEPFIHQGVIATWSSSDESPLRYLAAPRMNQICKQLAQPLSIQLSCQVKAIHLLPDGRWQLSVTKQAISNQGPMTETAVGPFDWVILTTPAPQACALLPASFSGYASLNQVKFDPCFSLMLGFNNQQTAFDWRVVQNLNVIVNRIVLNSDKPRRRGATTVVIYTHADWTYQHINQPREQLIDEILAASSLLIKPDIQQHIGHIALHRWLYANTALPLNQPYLLDKDLKLAVCGDCFSVTGVAMGVEGAFLSVNALSQVLGPLLLE